MTTKMKVIFTLFIILLNLTIIGSKAEGSFPPEFYEEESFKWNIENISSNINQWYNVSSFSFVANWTAQVNDLLSFAVTTSKVIDEKDYLVGNLEIGNLSLKADCQDIGFNLVLSIYPWYGGLVALEKNWETITATPPFNGSNVTVSFNEIKTIFGHEVEGIKIAYDDGFQQSELLYEPITGILLSAVTSSGNFWLELHLNQTTIPLPSPSTNISLTGIMFFLSGFIIIFFIKKITKRKII